MDADVARWVLEYILRQPLDDRTLNNLLRVLPIPNDNARLKKSMLLRRIESEIIKKGSIPEKLLGFLERIEELDYQEGIETCDSMKHAYCSVAVDCTVRFLDEREEYFDAVKRIWRGRVWKMERSERAVGLVCDELRGWRDDIEAAVWDPSVCENVRVKSRGNGVLEAVRVYVDEAWKSAGPSFLEAVAGTVSEDTMREVLGQGGIGDRVGGDSTRDSIVSEKDKESRRGGVLPRQKHVAMKHPRGATIGTSRGVKITDTEELDLRKLSNYYECLPSPEINEVQEALRTSVAELQAVVKDPLPEALRLAENVMSCMGGQNMNQESSGRGQNGKNVDAANPSVGTSPEAALANEANCDNQRSGHQNDVPKPSLMARNGTACTFEWDDSVDSLPEGSADHASRLHLSTPNRRLVSPLKKYQTPKISRRRKVKKWSPLEEDTLRTGVQKLGMGNWKVILNAYREIFEERTEVDLKDKWRNMTRY
ncbi:hypothetical protein RHSIM_Rhsim01G0242800 [Rhododendron simsii]|uniref:Uncharacterized protein n=1 Tax=Rhododendron simsii TaxID=118357 RepID=A0A834LY09_RHOSS|nr:hypothetical protein RHSIM_Rhsim01G0242800 [Rhododendron simsii]